MNGTNCRTSRRRPGGGSQHKEEAQEQSGRSGAVSRSEKRLTRTRRCGSSILLARLEVMEDKAMIVCMKRRRICVELYPRAGANAASWAGRRRRVRSSGDDRLRFDLDTAQPRQTSKAQAYRQPLPSYRRSAHALCCATWLTGFDAPASQ